MSRWIEYRVHWGADGDSHDYITYTGKEWRKWKQHIGEEGVQWIERVVCTEAKPYPYEEYECLWESEECIKADPSRKEVTEC